MGDCCNSLNVCIGALAGSLMALCWCLKLEYNLHNNRKNGNKKLWKS